MRGKDSLTFVLHPKQLVALRSKATEILYGGANRGKRPVLSWAGWRQLRGRPTPRFRTIQVCPRTSGPLCGRLNARQTGPQRLVSAYPGRAKKSGEDPRCSM